MPLAAVKKDARMGPLKIERQDRCESDVNSRFDRSRDPLAELARLIAQANSYPETTGAHEPYNTARSATAATVPVNGFWPGEGYGPQDQHLGERYAPPASGESHQSYEPQERGYEKDPPAARYFSGQAIGCCSKHCRRQTPKTSPDTSEVDKAIKKKSESAQPSISPRQTSPDTSAVDKAIKEKLRSTK
jgi:hypothetical protein